MALTTAVFRPDTVSPLDADAIAVLEESWEVVARLPNLMRGATRARRLADLHKDSARASLAAARRARTGEELRLHRVLLEEAATARRSATACCVFARRCEGEADRLAETAGFLA